MADIGSVLSAALSLRQLLLLEPGRRKACRSECEDVYKRQAVVIALAGGELSGFWLFVGSAILATVIEWIAGHILEWLYHEKWWDYSNVKWNLDGYICLPFSLLWGALSVFSLKWGCLLYTSRCV